MALRDINTCINYTSEEGLPENNSQSRVPFVGTIHEAKDVPKSVTLQDARLKVLNGELTLENNGFVLAKQRTECDVSTLFTPGLSEISYTTQQNYYAEMTTLIKEQTGADRVVILGHQMRDRTQATEFSVRNPFAASDVNGYAGVVHTDFCSKKAHQKFAETVKLLKQTDPFYAPEATPDEDILALMDSQYMLINTWRNANADHPIHDNMLACCDATSVNAPNDFLRVDVPLDPEEFEIGNGGLLYYKVPPAEQYRLKAGKSGEHRWYYFPAMKHDEVLIFKQFDSDPAAVARFCFHTSFVDPAPEAVVPSRQSIEVRAIAFFTKKEKLTITPCLSAYMATPGTCTSCTAASLAECNCGFCDHPASLPSKVVPGTCGCPNAAANPYHTCVPACGCSCGKDPTEDVPSSIRELYSQEDDATNKRSNLMAQLLGVARDDQSMKQGSIDALWLDMLGNDVVLRHSSTRGSFAMQVVGKEAVMAASASAATSPLNRSTWIKRYMPCMSCRSGEDQADQSVCCVVEGDVSYDHKMTREQFTLSFTAHLVFHGDKLVSRHTFSDIEAVAEFLQRLANWWSPYQALEMQLLAGAAHGLIERSEIDVELDTAVFTGAAKAATIGDICTRRGEAYDERKWSCHTGI